MTVAVQAPQRRSTLTDDIAKAVGIAQGVFGIVQGVKQGNRIDEQTALANQQRDEDFALKQASAQTGFLDKFMPIKEGQTGGIDAPKGLGLPEGIKYVERPQASGGGGGGGLSRDRFDYQIAQDKEKQKREIDKEVKGLTKDLERSKVPKMLATLKNIDKAIGGIDSNDDIPGIGATGAAPEFLLTQEGKNVRRAVSDFRNAIISAQAGANVTPHELERMLEQVGTGLFRSDEDLRQGLRNARNTLLTIIANAETGLSDEARTTYHGRSDAITTLDPFFDGEKIKARDSAAEAERIAAEELLKEQQKATAGQ